MLIKGVPGKIILASVVGSQAYGMATSRSDVDIKGVYIPFDDYIYGLKVPNPVNNRRVVSDIIVHPECTISEAVRVVAFDNGNEGVIYPIKQFIKLCAGGNPNVLEVLFGFKENGIYTDTWGNKLLDSRDMFKTLKLHKTYIGYAIGQLRKLKSWSPVVSKQAAHTLRLLYAAKHFFTTGELVVEAFNKDILQKVREEHIHRIYVQKTAEDLIKAVDKLAKENKLNLPRQVKPEDLNNLCMSITKRYLMV